MIYHEATKDLDAGRYLVQDLIDRLEKVKKDCGAKTVILIDAGHNNIDFRVNPSKKKPKNVWTFPRDGGQMTKVS